MQSPIPQLREKSHHNHPPFGGCESRLAGEALTQHGESMKQLLLLLAVVLLVPTTALAQVDPEVAAQCKNARDFYGCVRAYTTPARRSEDFAPLAGVMDQVAAGLISGPTYRNAPTNVSQGMNPAGLVKGILRGVLR